MHEQLFGEQWTMLWTDLDNAENHQILIFTDSDIVFS